MKVEDHGLKAMICCAGGGLRTISEAEAMKRYAEAVTRGGIPQANIVLEEVGTHSGLHCSGLCSLDSLVVMRVAVQA